MFCGCICTIANFKFPARPLDVVVNINTQGGKQHARRKGWTADAAVAFAMRLGGFTRCRKVYSNIRVAKYDAPTANSGPHVRYIQEV